MVFYRQKLLELKQNTSLYDIACEIDISETTLRKYLKEDDTLSDNTINKIETYLSNLTEVDKSKLVKQWDRLETHVINFLSDVLQEFSYLCKDIMLNNEYHIIMIEDIPKMAQIAIENVKNKYNIPKINTK